MERLNGKVILLAGGGQIGGALARRYAAEGASVLIGDIDAAGAEALAGEIGEAGGKAIGCVLDGRDDGSVGAAVELAKREFGGIDGLHANFATFADGTGGEDILTLPLETYDEVMSINARGFVLCTRHAVPAMLERGGGSIVYTSSGAAHQGDALRAAYSMSKAAVNALMRHVASRFGPEGIRANAIAPGVVIYPSIAHHLEGEGGDYFLRDMALKHFADPEDIAGTAAMLMSDDGRYITGQVISVDGGSSMRP
ncbi:MAG: SDR family NAD(P)-dependent oxidoreductase [Novosphingobium sp.]|nr:SDR family NAD(P)-dependent oxidoreductase [Novosphingobium sp.]